MMLKTIHSHNIGQILLSMRVNLALIFNFSKKNRNHSPVQQKRRVCGVRKEEFLSILWLTLSQLRVLKISFKNVSNFYEQIYIYGIHFELRIHIESWQLAQVGFDMTNEFKMSNGQVWEICREIDCHSASVIYYLKCET